MKMSEQRTLDVECSGKAMKVVDAVHNRKGGDFFLHDVEAGAAIDALVAEAVAAERDRCIHAMSTCGSLDEDGHVVSRDVAIKAIRNIT
jgi:PBP1b-binding outer membrane lipoprotein LpoB